MYEEEMDKVSVLADQLEFPAITADCWTLVPQDGYIGVTMHGITNDWTLKHKTLALQSLKERHSAETLVVPLQDVCKHYKINNPLTSTDNASSIVKTHSLFGWPRFPCFAHFLNLAMTASLEIRGC